MATRNHAARPAAQRGAKPEADMTEDEKRLAQLQAAERAAERAGGKRADDDAESDKDKDADSERDDDADAESDADDADSTDKDADGDDERGEDDEGEDKKDDGDGERAGPAAPGRRGQMSAVEVRKAAEAAVRADRIRGAKIREIAAQFGFPKLGERHANGETSVRAFKDLVLERLAERQKKRGSTTFAAAGTLEVDEGARAAAPAQARDYEKGAAEARALLGIK